MLYVLLALVLISGVLIGSSKVRTKLKEFVTSTENSGIVWAVSVILIVAIIALHFVTDIGSLIGGVLGGLGTLIAVSLTLRQNNKDRKIERINVLRPYLIIEDVSCRYDLSVILDAIPIEDNLQKNSAEYIENIDSWLLKIPLKNNGRFLCYLNIAIKNVGIGPAIQCLIKIDGTVPDEFGIDSNVTNIPAIKQDDVYNLHLLRVFMANISDISEDVLKSFNSFLEISYSSINGTKFKQQFPMSTSTGIMSTDQNDAIEVFEISIGNLSSQQINSKIESTEV